MPPTTPQVGSVIEPKLSIGLAGSLTGPYIGLQIGGAFGHDSAKVFVPGTDFDFPYRPQGVKGGFYVGWNYPICAYWVLGLEGDVLGSSFGRTFQPFEFNDEIFSTRSNIQGSIRGRSGIPLGPFFPYIAGGVAFANFRDIYDARPIGGDLISVSNTRVGYTVGGGIEYGITPNLSLRGEYRFNNFRFTDSSPETVQQARHNVTEHIFQVGVSYRPDLSVYASQTPWYFNPAGQ